MIDVLVVLVVRVHRYRRGEDSRAPTIALVEKLVLASVRSPQLQFIDVLSCRVDF